MIDDLDPHERSRGGEPARQGNVLCGGLGVARGMVVEEDESRRPRGDGFLEDLARVDEARGQAADGHDGLLLESVTHVEDEKAEGLDRSGAVAGQQVARDVFGRLEDGCQAALLRSETRPEFESGQQARGLGSADASLPLQILKGSTGQLAQSRGQQMVCDVEDGGGARSRPDEQGDELAGREGRGAMARQSLPRPLFDRQVVDAARGDRNRMGLGHARSFPANGPSAAFVIPSTRAKTGSLFVPSPVRQGKDAYNAAPMSQDGSVPSAALPSLLAPIVVLVGWGAMFLGGFLSRGLGLRPALVASEVGLALPALMAVALVRATWGKALGLRRIRGRLTALSLAAGAAFWGASLGLFELQYAVWRPPPGYLEAFQRLHEALRPAGPLDALMSVAAIALVPAIFEELLFRGVVLPSLLRSMTAGRAIFGSAALFGLIHLDLSTPGGAFYRVPFAFAVGLGLGLLRVRTGSLYPSILAHALLNTITFVVEPLTEDPTGVLPDPRPLLGAVLMVVGVTAAVWAVKRIDSYQASS